MPDGILWGRMTAPSRSSHPSTRARVWVRSLPWACVLIAALSACDTDSESTNSSSPAVAVSPIVTTPARGDGTSLTSVPSDDVECTSFGIANGPLTLKAGAIRVSGISPLLVFFDATGTTDASIMAAPRPFRMCTTLGISATPALQEKAPGRMERIRARTARNAATGGVAAHLYVTSGTDMVYTATVTASNGTNKASCHLSVTVYDPSGAKGFAGNRQPVSRRQVSRRREAAVARLAHEP